MKRHIVDTRTPDEVFLDSIIGSEEYKQRVSLESLIEWAKCSDLGKETQRNVVLLNPPKKYTRGLTSFFKEAERLEGITKGLEEQGFVEYFDQAPIKLQVLNLAMAY